MPDPIILALIAMGAVIVYLTYKVHLLDEDIDKIAEKHNEYVIASSIVLNEIVNQIDMETEGSSK